MSCDVTELELQSFADGELPAARAREVEAHVDACVACARFLEGERALAARVAALPRAIAPSPELWRAIETRIGGAKATLAPRPEGARRLAACRDRLSTPRLDAGGPGRARVRRAAIGLALAAAAAVAIVATRSRSTPVPSENVVASVVTGSTAVPEAPKTPAPAPEEEQPYLTALATLEADFANGKGALPPAEARAVED
ncbi:MAG TPA: anti-sigma factor, partial [Polyangiaceae bacterium]|nr:anti-sigma factor [Polyangiaceae bacterium]